MSKDDTSTEKVTVPYHDAHAECNHIGPAGGHLVTRELPPKAESDEFLARRDAIRNVAVVTPDRVRWRIMDYDTENTPMYERYLSDEDLWMALEETVNDFNETTPRFRVWYTLADFPDAHLLLQGAAATAMKITAMKEMRREMSYSDGGIDSNLYYKTNSYSQAFSQLSQEYEQNKRATKRQINISQCYGRVR